MFHQPRSKQDFPTSNQKKHINNETQTLNHQRLMTSQLPHTQQPKKLLHPSPGCDLLGRSRIPLTPFSQGMDDQQTLWSMRSLENIQLLEAIMHVSFLLCSFSKSNAVVKSTMDPIEPPWSCWAPHLLTNLIQETHQLFVPLEQRCQDEKHAASKRWQLKSRYVRIWNLSWRFFSGLQKLTPSSCVLFSSGFPNNQERFHVFHSLWKCFHRNKLPSFKSFENLHVNQATHPTQGLLMLCTNMEQLRDISTHRQGGSHRCGLNFFGPWACVNLEVKKVASSQLGIKQMNKMNEQTRFASLKWLV